jgi:predicted RNA-binding protein (virulence factor B family)
MTHLGMNAIVNNRYRGLIFHSDIHKRIYPGEKITGYVKSVRPDGKIDLLLEPPGYLDSVDKNAAQLYYAIRENEGFLSLNDNSDPEIIKKELGMSKKAFKKALGSLYKQKMIVLEEAGIRIIEET